MGNKRDTMGLILWVTIYRPCRVFRGDRGSQRTPGTEGWPAPSVGRIWVLASQKDET